MIRDDDGEVDSAETSRIDVYEWTSCKELDVLGIGWGKNCFRNKICVKRDCVIG